MHYLFEIIQNVCCQCLSIAQLLIKIKYTPHMVGYLINFLNHFWSSLIEDIFLKNPSQKYFWLLYTMESLDSSLISVTLS